MPKVERREIQSAHHANRDNRTSGVNSRRHEESKGVHLPGQDDKQSLNTTQATSKIEDDHEKPEKVLITGKPFLSETDR